MRLTLILLVGVLLGAPAYAADWIERCFESAAGVLATSSTAGAVVKTRLTPGSFVCAETNSNTDDAAVLDIHQCAQVDLLQFPDPDSDGTASTITGDPEVCPNSTSDDQACMVVPGGATLSGEDAAYNIKGAWMRIEAGGTANDHVRWMAFCDRNAPE